MTRYYEGLNEALDAVELMDKSDMLDYIDGLYGRDGLSEDYSIGELTDEVKRQVRMDYTKPETEKDRIDREWYTAIAKSIRGR